MKKVILLFGALLFVAFGVFAQTGNPKNDVFDLQSLEVRPGITVVLKKIPPSMGLVFPADNVGNCTISFHGLPQLVLTTNVSKDDGQHLQIKKNDFDGSKLVLQFAEGKLASIGSRKLQTPVEVPVDGTEMRMTVSN